jgi:FMN phosphatase YigB (HAD superfamily)
MHGEYLALTVSGTQTVRTFDVFDTVLTRSVGDPEAVHMLAARSFLSAGSIASEPAALATSRLAVEWRLHDHLGRPPTLEEIHVELGRALSYDGKTAQLAADIELDIERQVSRAVPAARRLLAHARAADGRVVFISDTPLPSSFLRELLVAHALWQEDDLVFASAERGASKADGGLWAVVEQALGAEPLQFLHLGDNKMADVASARVAGWRASQVLGTGLNRYESRLELDAGVTSSLTSALAGASRMARLEASEEGEPLGVATVAAGVAAPFLVGFALWLLDQARLRGLQRLYLVSRDGEVMLQVLERVARAVGSDVELRYLYGSRRVWHLASLGSGDRDDDDWIHADATVFSAQVLLDRVGLSAEEAHLSTGSGMFAPEQVHAVLGAKDRSRLREVAATAAFRNAAAARAASERLLLMDYLMQEGLGDGARTGIVDVGWLGSTSRSLDTVIRQAGLRPVDAFLYVGLTARASRYSGSELAQKQEAWLFDASRGRGLAGRLPDVIALIETFCAGSHGSVTGFTRGRHDVVLPVLSRSVNVGADAWGLDRYRKILLNTVDHLTTSSVDLRVRCDLRQPVWDLLSAFWLTPTQAEVDAWGSFPYDTDADPPELPLVLPIQPRLVLQELRRSRRLRLRHHNSWYAGVASASAVPWRTALTVLEAYRRSGPRLRRLPRRLRLERALRRPVRTLVAPQADVTSPTLSAGATEVVGPLRPDDDEDNE